MKKINKLWVLIFLSICLNANEDTSSSLTRQKFEVMELKKELNNFYNEKEQEYQERKKELEGILVQIQKEIELGIIKPIHPKQLVLDVLSMTVFPFAAQIMVRGMIGIPEDEFYQLMNERKTHIAKQIINSIKA